MVWSNYVTATDLCYMVWFGDIILWFWHTLRRCFGLIELLWWAKGSFCNVKSPMFPIQYTSGLVICWFFALKKIISWQNTINTSHLYGKIFDCFLSCDWALPIILCCCTLLCYCPVLIAFSFYSQPSSLSLPLSTCYRILFAFTPFIGHVTMEQGVVSYIYCYVFVCILMCQIKNTLKCVQTVALDAQSKLLRTSACSTDL